MSKAESRSITTPSLIEDSSASMEGPSIKRSKKLTCLDVIEIMCKRTKRSLKVALSKINHELLDVLWIKLIPGGMEHVIRVTGEKMMTLVPMPNQKETFKMVFDGTRMPQSHSTKVPKRYWYFNRDGSLKAIFLKPKWSHVEPDMPPGLPQKQSLAEALRGCAHVPQTLPHDACPSDHIELEKLFVEYGFSNVVVSLVTCWVPFCDVLWYNYVKGNLLVNVYAYRNADNEIQYTMLKDTNAKRATVLQTPEEKSSWYRDLSLGGECRPKVGAAAAAGKSQNPIFNTYSRYMNEINNRRSSMSVIENGLNLAYRLGVLTQEEFLDHGYWQSCFNGFLFCKLEHSTTITCMSYVDFEDSRSLVISSDKDWHSMFQYIQERCKRIAEIRRQALEDVLERLRPHGQKPVRSKFKQAYDDLILHSKQGKVYVYEASDSLMHALKLPLANYLLATEGKRFTSIWMRLSSDNSLVGLTYKYLSIVNFGAILPLEDGPTANYCYLEKLWSSMQDWNPFDSNSQPARCPYNYQEDPLHFCHEYARSLWNCLQNFAQHLLHNFSLDINTAKYVSLPAISNQIFWNAYHKLSPMGFLAHPVEKSMPANDVTLREFCHGGYTFSSHTEIHANQPIPLDDCGGTGENAQSLMSFDLNASYGYAATKMRAPGGFGSTWRFGSRQETSQRYRFFEFRAVFYTIYKWQQSTHKKLTGAYHNFGSLGIFSVGKFPIDLVGFFDDGSIELYQFDGAFCHGCRSSSNPRCPDLTHYADGKSRQELEDRTAERDRIVLDWVGGDQRFSLNIVTDCCNPEYFVTALNFYFDTIPELNQLIQGYSSIDGTIGPHLDSNLTFVAVAEVKCQPTSVHEAHNFQGPLFTSDSKEMIWHGRVLLTRDYLSYLCTNFAVEIGPIEWVVFYKVDRVIPLVYQHLLELRNNPSKNVARFYKQAVNLSCGYFGSNPNKKAIKGTRLVAKVPRHFSYDNAKIVTIDEFGENTTYPQEVTYHKNFNIVFVVHTYTNSNLLQINDKTCPPKPSLKSLPLFATIIEFGKMRLNQVFHFYSKHIPRSKLKVVYAHIDSTIIVVASKELKDSARDPEAFQRQWLEEFYSPEIKIPGFLHSEFNHDSSKNWKFVTPALCCWSVITDDTVNKIFKMPGISQTATQSDIYQKHSNLLHYGHTVIPTKRRKQKLAGVQMVDMDFNFVRSK